MKRIVSIYCVVALLFNIYVPVSGAESGEPSSWAVEYVNDAIEFGYVPEHLQENYQQAITREEFSELMVTAILSDFNWFSFKFISEALIHDMGYRELTVDIFLSKVHTTEYFTDTDNPYIKMANILGIVNGNGNHLFQPEQLITREQASIMILNYVQASTAIVTGDAQEISDFNQVSDWAKDAVSRAYLSGFITGVQPSIYDEQLKKFTQLAVFNPNGYLTREQAIILVRRLGRKGSRVLKHLILRGYVYILIDDLESGLDIDGDTIKLKYSDFDNAYSTVNISLRSRDMHEYTNKYTSSQLLAHFIGPLGISAYYYDTEHMDKVYSGQQTYYDFGIFTIEHNKDGYAAIITMRGDPIYFSRFGEGLHYGKNNEYLVQLKNNGDLPTE